MMLVRMPDTLFVAALVTAALALSLVIVHLAHQLRYAQHRIHDHVEALRLQAADAGIRPHLRVVGPPVHIHGIAWLRLHTTETLGVASAVAVAGFAVGALALQPSRSSQLDSAAPEPLRPVAPSAGPSVVTSTMTVTATVTVTATARPTRSPVVVGVDRVIAALAAAPSSSTPQAAPPSTSPSSVPAGEPMSATNPPPSRECVALLPSCGLAGMVAGP
jgi:hypothetical protein